MRNPIRSESDAFYIAVGSGALIAVAVLLGALVDPLVGLALLVGAVIGALVWEVWRPRTRSAGGPLREAASPGPPLGADDGDPRVLVVANRTLHGDELRDACAGAPPSGAELHVVAPILSSRIHYLASDVDKELGEARERLATALAWARAEGMTASGKVGDANARSARSRTSCGLFGADEVIISTYPPGDVELARNGHRGPLARRARHPGHAHRGPARPRLGRSVVTPHLRPGGAPRGGCLRHFRSPTPPAGVRSRWTRRRATDGEGRAGGRHADRGGVRARTGAGGPGGELEVAVVGLPARAARLDLDGGRPSQRRQLLELGRVEGVYRLCLGSESSWRTRIGRGSIGSAEPPPDSAPPGRSASDTERGHPGKRVRAGRSPFPSQAPRDSASRRIQ